MSSRVGERGQITIKKQIREELGVYTGDRAISASRMAGWSWNSSQDRIAARSPVR